MIDSFALIAVAAMLQAPPADAQRPGDGMSMPMPSATARGGSTREHAMSASEMAAMGSHEESTEDPMAHDTGALGPYPGTRETSGTSWQPDLSQHHGLMVMSGSWMAMFHGDVSFVADRQGGPRGDSKLFVAGMMMGMAKHPLGNGTLQLRAMLSTDPLMGKRGYPLLLESGETADGVTHLVDRQHPHDLFTELSVSVSQAIGSNSSLFVYAGLPGEPAFGPPAFMHRQSISSSPEAPISHHWLDSTHISFGVLTGGLVAGNAKIEVSRFNAREPDQHRYGLETGPLDSTAVRLSWNPIRSLSLQGSWGHFLSPEQLEPGIDQRRLSASASLTLPTRRGWWASTIAWGRKSIQGHKDDALAAESSWTLDRWTLFGRAERVENRELVDADRAYTVGKASIGAVYRIPVTPHLDLGLGGLYAFNFIPKGLKDDYGDDPEGMMAFARLSLR